MLRRVNRKHLSGKILICEIDYRRLQAVVSLLISYRNFRQTCDQIAGLDLSSWKSQDDSASTEGLEDIEPITTPAPFLDELNPDLISAAVERAKESLTERRRFEYEAWLSRKFSYIKM